MMTYKGYTSILQYDSEDRIFHGEVANLDAVITYEGNTHQEAEQAFKDSVDDYLEWCKERGKEPEKPFSGKLLLRLKPELHRELTQEALHQGISLNALINKKLNGKSR